ncbi:hypothetical protein [Alteriqipengyuania lutimaris]|nr:hypothetical protein [Alteriqipengyuania lutimaris]MBB3033938.1 hypothetical protein [Alteriqipengyuania lutimaris]
MIGLIVLRRWRKKYAEKAQCVTQGPNLAKEHEVFQGVEAELPRVTPG